MVRRGGAAAEGELGKPYPRRYVRRFLVELGPQRIEHLQPAEQGRRRHRAIGACEVLVEVVMSVDEARSDEAPGGRDRSRRSRQLVASPTDGRDQTGLDRDPPSCDLPTIGVDGRDYGSVTDEKISAHRLFYYRVFGLVEASSGQDVAQYVGLGCDAGADAGIEEICSAVASATTHKKFLVRR